MTSGTRETIVYAVMCIAIVGMIVWGSAFYDRYDCGQRWPGVEVRWDVTHGCQLKVEDVWVTEKTYRMMQWHKGRT